MKEPVRVLDVQASRRLARVAKAEFRYLDCILNAHSGVRIGHARSHMRSDSLLEDADREVGRVRVTEIMGSKPRRKVRVHMCSGPTSCGTGDAAELVVGQWPWAIAVEPNDRRTAVRIDEAQPYLRIRLGPLHDVLASGNSGRPAVAIRVLNLNRIGGPVRLARRDEVSPGAEYVVMDGWQSVSKHKRVASGVAFGDEVRDADRCERTFNERRYFIGGQGRERAVTQTRGEPKADNPTRRGRRNGSCFADHRGRCAARPGAEARRSRE